MNDKNNDLNTKIDGELWKYQGKVKKPDGEYHLFESEDGDAVEIKDLSKLYKKKN